MDLVLISRQWAEKGIIQNAEVDFVTAPSQEDAEISIKTPFSNPYNIEIGDYAAYEGTDFGGRLMKAKYDYSAGVIEFSGPSWWQYFEKIYVSAIEIKDKTACDAAELLLRNSQFNFYEVEDNPGELETFSFSEPLGDKMSLASTLKALENESGMVIKFVYARQKLIVKVGYAVIFAGLNFNNIPITVEANSLIPDFFVCVGNPEKQQFDNQTPSGYIDAETPTYPQTVFYYDCNEGKEVSAPSLTQFIFVLNCSENSKSEMIEQAAEEYAELLNSAYGVSGDLNDEILSAEAGDAVNFLDEVFNIEFTRTINRKILQKTEGQLDPSVSYELGEISYV